ncbi:MAG: hypothetical protein V4671_04400 [Armatimonadota bacterium]
MSTTSPTNPDRWQISTSPDGILWNAAADPPLPRFDHLEMSGRKVSVIVRYAVDSNRNLSVTREIIWPTLRLREGDVRGYLRRNYGDEYLPSFRIDGKTVSLGALQQVTIASGTITFTFRPQTDIKVVRTLFPSTTKSAVLENWTITNSSDKPLRISAALAPTREDATGVYGPYVLLQQLNGAEDSLFPGKTAVWTTVFSATRASDGPENVQGPAGETERVRFAERITRSPNHLHLITPDPILNKAFAFAKLRATESLFDTQMGLVHSPGGGRYYGGVWANDQAEYSGPFFAFLNDATANEAALNAYRIFAKAMTPEYKAVPSSFEVEGTVAWGGAGDRGDAAMIAGGASRFALTQGKQTVAEELWPVVQWCLEYCRRKTNGLGVVESDSDELEGRFPTGTANLSTSCLAYDGLRRGADLGRALGRAEEAAEYDRQADVLADAIERYFGAEVEGFKTYRYYEANTTLRAWICLPLVFDLAKGERRQGTIDALFSPRLWTADGLATEAGDTVFWDRSTLYALRAVFRAGATETAFAYLSAYSRRRLLGDHVPYPVEAHPEGGQAHLSAESALYCRVFLEGLLGITPTGLRSFTIAPYLPREWPDMELQMTAFGRPLTIFVAREAGDILRVGVLAGAETMLDSTGPGGTVYKIELL